MGGMFGKKKEAVEPETTAEVVEVEVEEPINPKFTPKKGKPTPKRDAQVAARKQPLVMTDRKAAKEREREELREARARQNEAMRTGDERYLPAVDKGKDRRYIRDYIDARRNLGDYMLYALMVVFLISFLIPVLAPGLYGFMVYAMYGLIGLWLIDYFIMWRKLKKKLIDKFGGSGRGNGMYAFNRVMVPRRFRRPDPQVAYGQYPS